MWKNKAVKTKIATICILFICGIIFTHGKKQDNKFNDLSIANIEALAIGESGSKVGCCSSIKYSLGGLVVYCADCTIWENYVDGTNGIGNGECTLN